MDTGPWQGCTLLTRFRSADGINGWPRAQALRWHPWVSGLNLQRPPQAHVLDGSFSSW